MLVVPLLLETGRHPSVQRVVVVDLPPAEQLRRSCVRDDSDPAVIKAIIAAQTGRDKRLLAADDILDNSGSLDNLRQQVEGLHRLYLKIANANNE